jgi:S1-C subfamily serine protease
MLVVDDVQPGSEADGKLSPGDMLIAIDGKPVPEFFALERGARRQRRPADQGRDPARRRADRVTLARAGSARHHARRIPRVRRSGRAHAVL